MTDPNLMHISERPWSNYSPADYTLQEWHSACLIHQHDGAPTTKTDCKLPVKTPTGTLNRNGVHAAAAALAGARGGVHASPEEKASAARALIRYYGQLSEDPPPSILNLAHSTMPSNSLDHHGVKGMHWGQRKARRQALREMSRSMSSVTPEQMQQQRAKRRKAAIATVSILGAYTAVGLGVGFLGSPQGNELMSRAANSIREKKAAKQANVGRIFVKNFIDANSRLVLPISAISGRHG